MSEKQYKDVSEWGDSDWKYYMEITRNYAKRTNKKVDPDDFVSFACEKKFNGRKAKISQLFIDYLRGTYGDTRSSCGSQRANANWHGTPEDYDYGSIRDNSESNQPDWELRRLCEKSEQDNKIASAKRLMLVSVIDNAEQATMLCLSFCGVSKENIALIFDKSSAYIDVIIDLARGKCGFK